MAETADRRSAWGGSLAHWVTAGILFEIAILVVFAYGVWSSLSPQDAGVFGDAFGAVNAFFSGLGFLGVILALRQQSIDGHEEREKLLAAQEQTEKQIKILAEQLALQRAQFEADNRPRLRNVVDIWDRGNWQIVLRNDGAPFQVLDSLLLTPRHEDIQISNVTGGEFVDPGGELTIEFSMADVRTEIIVVMGIIDSAYRIRRVRLILDRRRYPSSVRITEAGADD